MSTAHAASSTASITSPGTLSPADPGYAAAVAAFNTTITPRPALVVEARSPDDVVAAVRHAAAEGLAVTVQATGHGLVSDLADSLLVSTRHLDSVRVDPATATAVVGGGATWTQVIAAAAPHGLMPICGSASGVGVAGFLLGGGHGPLSREFGVGSDHLRRVRLVTADGVERDVDAERDPQLFAALRGGKAGFGIVTELEVGLVPVSRLYAGGVFFPGEAAPTILPAWRDWVATLPEEASSSIALLRLPPDPSLPPPLQDRFVVHLRFTTTASAERGAELLAPVRTLAEPIADLVTEMPAAALDAVHSDPTDPMPVWDGSALLSELPDAALDALLALAGPGVETPLIMAELRALGGAIDRGRGEPDSVAGRGAAFALYSLAPMFPPVAGVAPAVAKGVVDALAPWSVGSLPNFRGADHGGVLGLLWDDATFARLLEIARRYDPDGMFRRTGIRLA
jgi:hypothetical protein